MRRLAKGAAAIAVAVLLGALCASPAAAESVGLIRSVVISMLGGQVNGAGATTGQALVKQADGSWKPGTISSTLAQVLATGSSTGGTSVTFTDGDNVVLGTATGTQIGTGATQKLSFYGSTPVVQVAGSTDVLAGLVTLGLRGASSNPPLNLGSGALTAGASTLAATTVTTLGMGGTLTMGANTLALATATVSGTPTWSSNQAITLSTAAQPNVTSVGTLAGLTMTGTLSMSSTPVISGSPACTLGATTVTTLGTGGLVTLADGNNVAVGTTTGTQFGTATTQKIGFFGAAPVAQIAGSTDVLSSLVTLGLRAASSNPPLNLGSGALTAGNITGTLQTAAQTNVTSLGTLTSLNVNGTVTMASSGALAQNFTTGGLVLPICLTGAPSGAAANGNIVVGGDNHLWARLNGAWSQLDAQSGATPNLGAVVNAGNVVNGTAASGQLTWTTGGTYTAAAPEIFFPSDQAGFITCKAPAGSASGNALTLTAGAATTSGTGGAFSGNGGAGAGASGGASSLTGGATSTGGFSGGTASINGGSFTGGSYGNGYFQAFGAQSATAGTVLMEGGDAVPGGSNISGGAAKIRGGTANGNAASGNIQAQTSFVLASGTTAQTIGDRLFIAGVNKAMSNTTATNVNFCNLTLATTGTGGGCTVYYSLVANDSGAPVQVDVATGSYIVSFVNINGTPTATTSALLNETQKGGSGSVSLGVVTSTISGTNIQLNAAPTYTTIVPTAVTLSYTIIPFGRGVTAIPQ